jgi:hypothetical protein
MSDQTVKLYGYNVVTRASTGVVKDVSIYEGAKEGWTFQEPPADIPEGCAAYYQAPNWIVSSDNAARGILPPKPGPEDVPQTEPQVI